MLSKEIKPPGIVTVFENNNNTWEALKNVYSVKYKWIWMFLSNFHMHKKEILSCNIREISSQEETKESTNGYRKKSQTRDSNLLQYGSSQQLLYTYESPCTKKLKTALLLKQSTFICWF